MKTEVKKTTKHYCGECDKELKYAGVGDMSIFDFSGVTQRYCANQKCDRYGLVTVASVPKEETL